MTNRKRRKPKYKLEEETCKRRGKKYKKIEIKYSRKREKKKKETGKERGKISRCQIVPSIKSRFQRFLLPGKAELKTKA